ncbi:MAG TPA: TIGR04290 family methyltransferase [Bryobacteraceae bacterium]|jgi:tRNA (mo5U34)-methyltransferase|nr:TIGR04290 family methyltransferase [Bryobacteraceae bacterium]
MNSATMPRDQIKERIAELGTWFHNIDLGGVQTAPNHFLGDYPSFKWQQLQASIPSDLSGKTVLDIGCNGGFYSIEMKRRGAARVIGIDSDPAYLNQARFAAQATGADIQFHQLDVYDIAALKEKFDIVLFMGVLYHLRHPLLALDLLHEHVVRDTLIFQSMLRGSSSILRLDEDYPFSELDIFQCDGFPLMHFVEHSYAEDPTNWWVPNRACVEAMLRSSGFEIVGRPEDEIYICRRRDRHG